MPIKMYRVCWKIKDFLRGYRFKRLLSVAFAVTNILAVRENAVWLSVAALILSLVTYASADFEERFNDSFYWDDRLPMLLKNKVVWLFLAVIGVPIVHFAFEETWIASILISPSVALLFIYVLRLIFKIKVTISFMLYKRKLDKEVERELQMRKGNG